MQMKKRPARMNRSRPQRGDQSRNETASIGQFNPIASDLRMAAATLAHVARVRASDTDAWAWGIEFVKRRLLALAERVEAHHG